ncbi:TPA: antibiotic biosynthesis monooxygenase [Stenotrophomonas maltophilia]
MHPRTTVLELAVFTVKPEARAEMPALRLQLRAAIAQFPGLIDYQPLSPMDGDDRFVDIAHWQDLASAQAVAQAFAAGDARFAPYMAAIDELHLMQHFLPG